MKTFSNDIFVQTRSVLNEMRQKGFEHEDSIMSLLVLLFVIDAHKKKWEEPEDILNNEGYDFFYDLEHRAYDLEDDEYYDLILSFLRKLDGFKDIVIKNKLFYYYFHVTESMKIRLIDQLIEDLSKNSKSQFAQISNDRLNIAFSKVVKIGRKSRILDPCIGSGKLIVDLYKEGNLDPESVWVYGIEKNPALALLANINLKLNGFKNVTVHIGDAIDYLLFLDDSDLLEERYDLIISDLPMGMILKNKNELTEGIPSTLRFYYLLIQQCRKALTKEGKLYITSNSGLVKRFRSLSVKTEELPITVLIDISDTAQWSYTHAKPYILVLDKEVQFPESETHLVKLNQSGEVEELNIVDRFEFDFFSNVEDFSFFFSSTFDRIYYEGRENFDTLSQFFLSIKKSRVSLRENPEIKDSILTREFIQDTSGYRRITSKNLDGTKPERFKSEYVAQKGDWILAHQSGEIKVLISGVDKVVLPLNCIALKPKYEFSDLIQDWLIAQIRSEFLQAQLMATISDLRPGLFRSKLILNKLFIDRHAPEEKERFVSKWKEARIEALEKEKKEVEARFADVREKNIEEQIDLIHDLHHSLKNELSIITGATKSITDYLEKMSNSKKSVSLDDPVRTPRKGADPKLQKSVGERLRALQNASYEMSIYLNHYKSILNFDPKRQNPVWVDLKKYIESILSEYSGFNTIVTEEFDQLKSKSSDQYYLKCDKSVMRLVITNIVSNAIKYGFTNENIQYSLKVEIQEFPFDNVKWLETYPEIELPNRFLRIKFSNDGNPLPKDIEQVVFFRKGFVYGANAGSGIGTYHIKKGTEAMGGQIWLNDPDEDDPYQFQLVQIFPYPLYKTKNQLKDEGELL